ncbi:hypothetical protein [Mycobacteroides chelonae]|uniref:hypothetical protein n=1 Tax=Mycobacteroides chelonae TaxID=1774 RepID=UPI001C2C097A|nr:hypothetical protein [Mycobacteroides chelonae]MBV0915917.1 hypothetical protein [Mycobacteroides chelonae]
MRTLPIVGAVTSAIAALMLAGVASADPDTPNPLDPSGLPNVNGLTPVSPLEYSVLADTAYGFTIPGGISCMIKRADASYGCSGPLPGAPNGANLVSGSNAPGFASTDRPIYGLGGDVFKPLAPGHRLSYREVSCGLDGGGTLTCVNNRWQNGFVVGPGGSYTT